MTCLSFKSGRPIAKIEGGEHNGKTIHIQTNDNNTNKSLKGGCCGKCGVKCKGGCCGGCCKHDDSSSSSDELPSNQMEILEQIILNEMKGRGTRQKQEYINELSNAINGGVEPENKSISKYYRRAKDMIDDKCNKEIKISEGVMQPVPNPQGRQCQYISAPSGSGKSTYVSNYVKQYKKMYPKRKVFLFSKLDEDPALDKYDIKRIELDDEIISNPIMPEELKDSLVIFDDTDTLRDKAMKDELTRLKNDLLETGRHTSTDVAITSHMLTNYKETRTVLNECHSITIFPSSGSAHAIKYCLKTYVGLDKNDIDRIMKLKSRWVTIYKNFPQAVLYEHGAYLISKE